MSKHPVPQSLLVHIGDMTVSFALLEFAIRGLFGSFIREHQRVGQILSAELSFSSLLGATSSLYRDRHGEDGDYAVLKSLLSRAAAVQEERNAITHSVWTAAKKPDAVTRVKTSSKIKTGYRVQSKEYDATVLKSFVEQIKTLDDEIMKLHLGLIERRKAIHVPLKKMW